MQHTHALGALATRLLVWAGLCLCIADARAADQDANAPDDLGGRPPTAGAEKAELPPSAPDEPASSASKRLPAGAPAQLNEVTVTGSRLFTGKAEGPQRVEVYTRQQIEQTGRTSINDFLNTVPDVSTSFTEGAAQSGSGQTTVKLHGLPAGTTLVLINGRRVQDSAITLGSSFASNFFDLNNIPLSAVERIEVLPEGASAVYGSDAIAGVVNIILRQGLNGFEARAMYSHADHLPQWDADFAAGTEWSHGAFMLLGSVQRRGTLDGFHRAVTATDNHSAEGGLDVRKVSCATPNVFGLNGANLPGLAAPYAAVPSGYTGTPSIQEFSGTAGSLNKCSLNAYNSYVPRTERDGLFAQGHLDLTDSIQAFAEFIGSRVLQHFDYYPFTASAVPSFQVYTVSASNPFNPFGAKVGIGALFPSAPLSYESSASFIRPVIGLRGGFGQDGQWESAIVYSRDLETRTTGNVVPDNAAIQARFNSSDPSVAFNPFVDAPFDSPSYDSTVFHPYIQKYSASDLGAQVFVRGTVLQIPTGPLRAVAGAEYHRYQLYTDNGNYAGSVLGPSGTPATFNRYSFSAFGESQIPIVRGPDPRQGPAALQATIALRYDRFSDFGSTTNPQYGLEWRPAQGLLLRAAYGDTFRAPPLFDLHSPVVTSFPFLVRDPQHGNQVVPVTVLTGGNSELQAETGSTTSFGVAYAAQDIDASITQWRIRENSNIQKIAPQTLVNNPDIAAGAVVRDASGTLTLVNATFVNFGAIEVAGLSFHAAYHHRSPYGTWTPALAGTYTYRYQLALTPHATPVNAVSQAQDTGIWAPRWKSVLSLGWNKESLTINGAGRYVGSYHDYDSTRLIGSFWYFDLNGRYDFGRSAFGRPSLEVGAINLFDRLPQVSRYDFGFGGYDPAQADIRGRVLYARVSTKF